MTGKGHLPTCRLRIVGGNLAVWQFGIYERLPDPSGKISYVERFTPLADQIDMLDDSALLVLGAVAKDLETNLLELGCNVDFSKGLPLSGATLINP